MQGSQAYVGQVHLLTLLSLQDSKSRTDREVEKKQLFLDALEWGSMNGESTHHLSPGIIESNIARDP